eukprot:COSAG05_NODE_508_length_9135_cov_30.269780_4_plen_77_part_00
MRAWPIISARTRTCAARASFHARVTNEMPAVCHSAFRQAAFLFILMSSIAPLVDLSYLKVSAAAANNSTTYGCVAN